MKLVKLYGHDAQFLIHGGCRILFNESGQAIASLSDEVTRYYSEDADENDLKLIQAFFGNEEREPRPQDFLDKYAGTMI